MTLRLDLVRRQIRAFTQWLDLALEIPGETQARIYIRYSHPFGADEGKARTFAAFGDDLHSYSRRPENL